MHRTAWSVPQNCFWLMIVSTASAVLPVLTVADDELALTPAYGIMASMALMPVWSGSRTVGVRPPMGPSRKPGLGCVDGALAVQRIAQRVDHPAEQLVAHDHRQDPPSGRRSPSSTSMPHP